MTGRMEYLIGSPPRTGSRVAGLRRPGRSIAGSSRGRRRPLRVPLRHHRQRVGPGALPTDLRPILGRARRATPGSRLTRLIPHETAAAMARAGITAAGPAVVNTGSPHTLPSGGRATARDQGRLATPRMWGPGGRKAAGLKGMRSHVSITSPACSIPAVVSRARWHPPATQGQKVASARRWKRASKLACETTCS